ELNSWKGPFSNTVQKQAVRALEGGKILYLPALTYDLKALELPFLNPDIIDPKSKNVSYDIKNDRLAGARLKGQEADALKEMVKRYALLSRQLLLGLIPAYESHLIQAKTSFRPVEIHGRKTSYRKDDTRLHVDAFPSNPTKGQRILRVFTN